MKNLISLPSILIPCFFVLIACDETAPEVIIDRPECIISSVIFEDKIDNPHVVSYNDNEEITTVIDVYEKYIFHYTDHQITKIEVFEGDAYHGNYELIYEDDKIIYFNGNNLENIPNLSIKYIYENGMIKKEEWYRYKDGTQYLDFYKYYEVENGNIVKLTTTTLHGDATTSSGETTYEYYSDVNQFKNNEVIKILFPTTGLEYFNKNLVKRSIRTSADEEKFITNYTYELNENGFPTKIFFENSFEKELDYQFTYYCKDRN